MSRWVLRPPVESWGELFLGSMKDSILGFNQPKVLSLVKELKDEKTEKITTISIDVEDLLILSIIADLSNRKSIRKVILEDGQYSWISYNLILEDLPILRIDKKQLRRRLDKLVEFDLIDLKVERVNGSGTFVYIKIGQMYEDLKYGKADENEDRQKSTEGVDKKVYGGGQKSTPKDSSIKQGEEDNKEEKDKSFSKKDANADVNEFVDRMYALYPAKCPKRGTYLGKSQKDKVKIKSLLKTYSESDIEFVIRWEIEQKYNKAYMLNFSTFLNNFPDPTQIDGYNKLNNTSTNTLTLPKGWTQERYDMYIRNGYTITEDGRLFKDGKEYK